MTSLPATTTEYRYKVVEGTLYRLPTREWYCNNCDSWVKSHHYSCRQCGHRRKAQGKRGSRKKIDYNFKQRCMDLRRKRKYLKIMADKRYKAECLPQENLRKGQIWRKGHEIDANPWWIKQQINKVDDNKLKAELRKKHATYYVGGQFFTMGEVMANIVNAVANGAPLIEYLKSETGLPPLMEVRQWRRRFPKFDEDIREAEKAFGDILYAEGLNIAMSANHVEPVISKDGDVIGERTNAQVLKLKVETAQKAAAKFNEKYLDKQIQQVEDITDRMNREQMLDRLRQLVAENPELKEMMPDVIPGEVIKDEA